MNVRRAGWPRLLQYWQRQLQRDFHGRRPVVGVEHACQTTRQHGKQPFGQIDGRPMGAVGEDDVLELAGLRRQRLVQLRMRMAVNVHPPGRSAVEEARPSSVYRYTPSPRTIGIGIRPRQHLRVRDARGAPRSRATRPRPSVTSAHPNSSVRRPSGSSSDAAQRPSASGVSGLEHGSSPTTGHSAVGLDRLPVVRDWARRPSGHRRSSASAARSASSVSSVWLMVPRVVRATTSTGKPSRAIRSTIRRRR